MTPCQERAVRVLTQYCARSQLDPMRLPLFISGGGGTGKSHVLKVFRSMVESTGKRVVTVATQAIAATLIGGRTVHSVFSIKEKPNLSEQNGTTTTLTCGIDTFNGDVLIVDEVSMMSSQMLDAIEQCLVRVKQCPLPFGGVNVCVFGDLLQLAPVGGKPVFKAKCWHLFRMIPLVTNVRHADDELFAETMSSLRLGDKSCIDLINSRCVKSAEEIEAIHNVTTTDAGGGVLTIVSTNAKADTINKFRLTKCMVENSSNSSGSSHLEFDSRDTQLVINNCGDIKDDVVFSVSDMERIVPKKLTILIGATMMFTCNDRNGQWCNGDVVVVQGYDSTSEIIKLRHNTSKLVFLRPDDYKFLSPDASTLVIRYGYPLRYGWAATIHKVQGSTHDSIVVDPSDMFCHGQLYVALSRTRSFRGLTLVSPLKSKHLVTSSGTLHVYKTVPRYSDSEATDQFPLTSLEMYNRINVYLQDKLNATNEALDEATMELALERVMNKCSVCVFTSSCRVCCQQRSTRVCVPCGHFVVCSSCTVAVCPVCATSVTEIIVVSNDNYRI